MEGVKLGKIGTTVTASSKNIIFKKGKYKRNHQCMLHTVAEVLIRKKLCLYMIKISTQMVPINNWVKILIVKQ